MHALSHVPGLKSRAGVTSSGSEFLYTQGMGKGRPKKHKRRPKKKTRTE
jgi:hypothetical protein